MCWTFRNSITITYAKLIVFTSLVFLPEIGGILVRQLMSLIFFLVQLDNQQIETFETILRSDPETFLYMKHFKSRETFII